MAASLDFTSDRGGINRRRRIWRAVWAGLHWPSLVDFGGFAAEFEVPGEQDEWGDDQREDAEDEEAVHEGEQPGLILELVVVAVVGGGERVGVGEAMRLQVGGGLSHRLLQNGRGAGKVAADHGL